MPSESSSDLKLEIAHVLFIDLVGYSKLLIDEQSEILGQLNEVIRGTTRFREAEAARKVIPLPSGDGMALVFLNNPDAPVECALEISEALQKYPRIQLRMGVHSGPVSGVTDVNTRSIVAGAGINMAQRVMDIGDAGHILLSKRAAEDLLPYRQWDSCLHDLGEFEVEYGVKISVVNLYTDKVGNPKLPEKLIQLSRKRAAARRLRRTFLTALLLVAVALPAGVLIFTRRTPPKLSAGSAATIPEKSIAVLPFQNLSDDRANAFFADGIQDDILTHLAKIADLKVISRSSVMQYRGASRQNLRETGKALGVGNILEGSVRREGNRVVVSVQLIDAVHDRHLWANRYDRTLADSLGLQGELASEIASALRARLSPEEKARVETKPTENADAYVFYLRANQIERSPDTLLEDYKTAEQLYLQAIALDPNFALAHARLASTRAQIFHYYEPLDSWKTKARNAASEALRLQPNLAEAHLALGQCLYWMDDDYERALEEFAIAGKLAPNDTESARLVAAIRRRQGRWQESLDSYERIAALDPQNPAIVRNLLFTNAAMRRWPEAARAADRMRAMVPNSLVAKTQRGYIDFLWKGDTHLLKSLLSEVPKGVDPDGVVTASLWEAAMIDRDFAAAQNALKNSPLEGFDYLVGGITPRSFLEGCIPLAQGNVPAALEKFEVALGKFEATVKESPMIAEGHANLGLCYAFMGRKEDALREGRRAVELKPESKDAYDGAIMSSFLALIYTRVGEADLAFPLLERLLKTPGAVDSAVDSITVNDLKFRWEWDPIRSDPRFQKLIAPVSSR